MNRWLTAVGVVSLALAAFIWVHGQRVDAPTRRVVPVPISASNPPIVSQATPTHVADPVASTVSAEPSTITEAHMMGRAAPAIPLPSSTIKPGASPLVYAAAHGRPDGLSLAIASSGPGIAMQAMPRIGTAEFLTGSTLGGVESQQWVAATWALADGGAIQVDRLTAAAGNQAGPLVLALDRRGVWTVTHGVATPDLAASAIEVARTITLLRGGFAMASAWSPGQEARLGGELFRVIHAQGRLLLLAAANDAQDQPTRAGAYPDESADPGWNDVAIWLGADGRWMAAERLVAAPATRDEPGFLVRRSIVRFQH